MLEIIAQKINEFIVTSGFGQQEDGCSVRDKSTSADPTQKVRPQAWVDTPQLIYSQWNLAAGGIDEPLGHLPPNLKICLVGAGISNLILAFNLRKAGADVTLIEASKEVGGRLRSKTMPDGVNVAEMGAMRFPPSEDLLYYYAEAFGFAFITDFPDPGKIPTIVSYQGVAYNWTDENKAPPGFEKVYYGWEQLMTLGVCKDGDVVLASPAQFMEWLRSPDVHVRARAIPAWQKYLDEFGTHSFFTGLQRIFGPRHEWDVPGGKFWSEEDFQRFALLGIGSGGFGPFFSVGFNSIFRLVANGLETNQAIFAKLSEGIAKPAGIQELAIAIWKQATVMGVKTKLETIAEIINAGKDECGNPYITVKETTVDTRTSMSLDYDLVLVGTTNRAMNHAISMTDYHKDGNRLLSHKVCRGVDDVHMISSSKLFIRTMKFWKDQAPDFPRVILSDTKSPQTYTLDYGHEEYGMVLVSYTWKDLSNQMMAVQDPLVLLGILKQQIASIMRKTKYPDYADLLIPVTADDIHVVHWQLDPHSYGAFTLATPGQDKYIAAMLYDFEKLGSNDAIPLLIGSDCTSFLGGWVDGGLQAAHNNLSAVFRAYGSLNPAAAHLAPVNLLDSNLYRY